jgi:hypothetical protein
MFIMIIITAILIPRNVEIPCSFCSSFPQSFSSMSFQSNSPFIRIESSAFAGSSLQTILIPCSVKILCSSCFSFCESLSSISFESNSRLTRIESSAFSYSSLQSIVIPLNVRFIDGSAFCYVNLSSITIENGNNRYVVENDFLIDFVDHQLIRIFSKSTTITIPKDIEILCSNCFSLHRFSLSLSFELHSRLRRIESQAIPRRVVRSRRPIQRSIDLPGSIEFIASDAFPFLHEISLSEGDSIPSFHEWKRVRLSGIAVDFRRIEHFDARGFDFENTGLICGQDGHSKEISRRVSDGLLMLVESVHISGFRSKIELERTFEILANLRHPCISAPLGFVIPTDFAVSDELKIVQLHCEGDLLSEVISVNPVWLTPTAKAKAIVGLVLGLRFWHSLGLMHGHLASNNVRFGSDHRIEINANDGIRLHGGVWDEGWTPKADLCGFSWIFYAIIVGHSVRTSTEVTFSRDVPTFVSEIITMGLSLKSDRQSSFHDIFHTLKKHNFEILSGINSAEVSAFVRWVELSEQFWQYKLN